mgnify:FL=1
MSDKVEVPESFFTYLGAAATEGHSLYRLYQMNCSLWTCIHMSKSSTLLWTLHFQLVLLWRGCFRLVAEFFCPRAADWAVNILKWCFSYVWQSGDFEAWEKNFVNNIWCTLLTNRNSLNFQKYCSIAILYESIGIAIVSKKSIGIAIAILFWSSIGIAIAILFWGIANNPDDLELNGASKLGLNCLSLVESFITSAD